MSSRKPPVPQPPLQAAYAHCKAGGTIVQLGVQGGPIELPVNLVMQKELTVRGSFRFAHVFPQALDLLARQQLDVAPPHLAVRLPFPTWSPVSTRHSSPKPSKWWLITRGWELVSKLPKSP